MTSYTRTFDNLTEEDIDALRCLGAVTFTFTYEAESRRKAIRELTEEFEWRGFTETGWDERLSGKRNR